jgi:uncharacterized protein
VSKLYNGLYLRLFLKIKHYTKYNMSVEIEELILLTTTDCNLNCLYCYAGAGEKKHPMDWQTALLSLSNAVAKLHCRSIQISGGEPLLNPDLLEKIAEFSRLHCLRLKIQTNATLIDADLAARLKSWQAEIGVSLDGLAEINDRTRRGPASTREALRGLYCLKQVGLTAGLTCVVSALNYRHLKDIVLLAIQAGNISGISFDVIRPSGRAALNAELLEMDSTVLQRSMNEAIQVCLNMRKLFGSRLIIRELDKMLHLSQSGRPRRFRCYFDACRQIAVTPDGDIYPCAALQLYPEMKLGDIRDKTIWDRLPELLEVARNKITVAPQCSDCADYAGLCGGPCPAQLYARQQNGGDSNTECCVRKVYLQNRNTGERKAELCNQIPD